MKRPRGSLNHSAETATTPQCRRIPAFRLPAMVGWREELLAAAVAALWGCVSAAAQAAPVPPCGGAEIARGTVSRVIDGRDFVLDNSREVRLSAVEIPPPDAPAAPGGSDAKATLDALIGGDTVILRKAELATDRYGRIVAYAYAVRDGKEIFAQGELIAAGKESYFIVSQFNLFEYEQEAPLFARLSDRFERCILGLTLVREDLGPRKPLMLPPSSN